MVISLIIQKLTIMCKTVIVQAMKLELKLCVVCLCLLYL